MNDKSIYDARLMKLNTEHALSTVKNFHFDGGKASRLISGIAISSCLPNANDTSFLAKGVDFTLPTPLLWNHQWERPLGRVISVERRGDALHFKAEIGNNMFWIDQIWAEVIARNAAAVSVGGESLLDPVCNRTFAYWRLNEISVGQVGADPGAVINRCWERLPYVPLNRPNETQHWSAQCG